MTGQGEQSLDSILQKQPSGQSGDFGTICPKAALSVIPCLLALCRGGPGSIFLSGLLCRLCHLFPDGCRPYRLGSGQQLSTARL